MTTRTEQAFSGDRIEAFRQDIEDAMYWDARVHAVQRLLAKVPREDTDTRAALDDCLRIARDARRRSWRGENRPMKTASVETIAAIERALTTAPSA